MSYCESETTTVSMLLVIVNFQALQTSIIFWTYYFQHHRCRFSGIV